MPQQKKITIQHWVILLSEISTLLQTTLSSIGGKNPRSLVSLQHRLRRTAPVFLPLVFESIFFLLPTKVNLTQWRRSNKCVALFDFCISQPSYGPPIVSVLHAKTGEFGTRGDCTGIPSERAKKLHLLCLHPSKGRKNMATFVQWCFSWTPTS